MILSLRDFHFPPPPRRWARRLASSKRLEVDAASGAGFLPSADGGPPAAGRVAPTDCGSSAAVTVFSGWKRSGSGGASWAGWRARTWPRRVSKAARESSASLGRGTPFQKKIQRRSVADGLEPLLPVQLDAPHADVEGKKQNGQAQQPIAQILRLKGLLPVMQKRIVRGRVEHFAAAQFSQAAQQVQVGFAVVELRRIVDAQAQRLATVPSRGRAGSSNRRPTSLVGNLAS